MYTVVYYGQHTCKDNGVNSSPDDSETHTTRSNSDSQSSTSSACTDPCDNQNQTSLHDNKPIDDKSEKLVTKDMYEPFDKTAFAPLDLDSWELDALLRFGA